MQSSSNEVEVLNHTIERLQKTPFSAQKQIVGEIKQVISNIFGSHSSQYTNITKFKLINQEESHKKIEALIWTQWEYVQKRELVETLHRCIEELEMKNKM